MIKSFFFPFCRQLITYTKSLDPTRPVTFITDSNYARDQGVSVLSLIISHQFTLQSFTVNDMNILVTFALTGTVWDKNKHEIETYYSHAQTMDVQ